MQRLTTLLLLAGITITSQAQTNCGLLHDSNANGFVDIEDFLSILGLFGDQDSDGDGVYDSQDNCIDLAACNFMEVDAEFCFYPDAIGDCNGNCPLDADGDGVCDLFSCGSSVDYQGYDYTTVLIGDQCWFAQNLRSENYNNGDAIPSGLSNSEWNNTSYGAVAVYGEGNSSCNNFNSEVDACDEAWALNENGRLYNWHAVDDARGLCPSGWQVPTDEEWMTMEIALGMSETETQNNGSFRGTDQGTQMKADYGWSSGGNGTNSSGFSGSPGGYRHIDGNFYFAGQYGYWHSSSQGGPGGWTRTLASFDERVYRTNSNAQHGYSVRCIKD